MEDLEIDCLVKIFQRLSIEDLIVGVPFVCTTWYKASFDPLCYKVLDFESLDLDPKSRFAKRCTSRYNATTMIPSLSSIVKLLMHRSRGLATEIKFPIHGVSIDDLCFASTWCPRLKRITMPELKSKDEVILLQMMERWKELEELEMESKPSNFGEVVEKISINCGKFRRLKMCGSIERRDALAIVECLPNIKALDLSRSYLPKENLMMIMKGCKEIEELRVNGCIGFEKDRSVLEAASNIRVFECEGSKVHDCFMYWNGMF